MSDSPPPPVLATVGRFRLAGARLNGNPQSLAAQWRGAVAARFPGNVAFHGHDGERPAAPRYPEVHYRWVDDAPALFAFGPAAHLLMTHPWPGVTLRLGEVERTVAQVEWSPLSIALPFSRDLVRYEFCAPWLALNQQNFERYRSNSPGARRAQLDSILRGNLLTMSQAFDRYYNPGEIVYAAFEIAGDVSCTVKGVSVIGFEGCFVTNLDLPDGLALGRTVSHGFGWFRRLAA